MFPGSIKLVLVIPRTKNITPHTKEYQTTGQVILSKTSNSISMGYVHFDGLRIPTLVQIP